MTEIARERPCIHVCVLGGAAPELYRWVEIGAEEEGLPTRQVEPAERDVIASALAAAQSSRFDIGVALDGDRVVLHEAHMPPAQPVLAFELAAAPRQICRLMGGNAARMVVRLPLRFWEPALAPAEPFATRYTNGRAEIEALARAIAGKHGAVGQPATGAWSDGEVRRIAQAVARILRERGLQ